jgi:hypothetical protein
MREDNQEELDQKQIDELYLKLGLKEKEDREKLLKLANPFPERKDASHFTISTDNTAQCLIRLEGNQYA